MQPSAENLKTIRFESELLPNWAQLLDIAARLTSVSDETQKWFSRFTNSTGVDDARTVILQCEILLTELRRRKESVVSELTRTRNDSQALQIVAAWEYALETMMQEARSHKTCSWHVEGAEQTSEGDFGDGDVSLRRV